MLRNNQLEVLTVMKDAEDGGDVEYNIFDRNGRCELLVDALLLCLSLFLT